MDTSQNIQNIQNIQIKARPSPQDVKEAITDFISDWCLGCDLKRPPCPPSTIESCPIVKRLKAVNK